MPLAIGDVRPSQVITTYGPGAIVDLQTVSVIVVGTDRWPRRELTRIQEPRLERALGVKGFFAPAPAAIRGVGTLPARVFPRFQLCPICKTLSQLGTPDIEFDQQRGVMKCAAPGCEGKASRRAITLPAPFIVACQNGHIDDFPWTFYVHRGEECSRRMKLESRAVTGSVADLNIRCECGKQRSASDAFGERRSEALGKCRGARPWLGRNSSSSGCTQDVIAMQRGATNAWFATVRSALAINESATPLGLAVDACDLNTLRGVGSREKLRQVLEIAPDMFPSLKGFSADDVWEYLERRVEGVRESTELDIRWPEWEALRAKGRQIDTGELVLEEGQPPASLSPPISRVVLARRLLEVRALYGFTRIDPAGASSPGALSIEKQDWLPAVQVRGEGIFLELDEAKVAAWEREVEPRTAGMARKHAEWERERGRTPTPFPGARYVLLHTLAHVLIRQLALDCGYSASSIRERIYSSAEPNRRMAGILLYTASPDSEGSLGGLVDLGRAERLPGLLSGALAQASRCSSDPLCADHDPDLHASINGAACHACVLAPETSCESFNRFLDRNMLVPTVSGSQWAFFR